MTDPTPPPELAQPPVRIAIDDLAEAASAGVLRALEARRINASDFVAKNGFFVNLMIYAGGNPTGGTTAPPIVALPGRDLPSRDLPQ